MKRAIAMGLGVVGLAGAGWFALSAPEPVVASAPVRGAEAPAAAPASAVSPRAERCVFEAGERLSYSLEVSARSRLALANQEAPVDTALRGRLTLEAAEVGQTGAVMLVKVDRVEGQTADLSAPFVVEVAPDCSLARFGRQQRSSISSARAQQALLWDGRWSMTEGAFSSEDGLGPFAARVVRAEQQRRVELSEYRSLWGVSMSPTPVTGLVVAALDDGKWAQAVTSTRTLDVPAAQISSRTSLLRIADDHTVSFSSEERDLSNYVWGSLLSRQQAPRAVRQVTSVDLERRAAAAPLSMDEALTAYSMKATDPNWRIETSWQALSAWFETHPKEIAAAVDELKRGRLKSDREGTSFYIALGNARVPEAREALLAIKRETDAPPLERMRALFSLVDREDVGTELAKELATDAQALTSASTRTARQMPAESLLALTVMSGLRDDAELKDISAQAIRAALQTPGDHAVARTGLRAIGNTGDPALLTEAERFISSSDVKTRRAAADAFRRMPPQSTDDMVAAWLARESDVTVKAAVYDVVRNQHLDAMVPANRALAQQALADLAVLPTRHARRELVRLLGDSVISKEPEVRAALLTRARSLAKKDSDELNDFTDVLTDAEKWEVFK